MLASALMPGLDASPNLHPLLVHFPIALWSTALLFWGLGALRSRDELFRVGTWLLTLGTIAGALTLASGYLAADGLGHDSPGHGMVHEHRDYMLIATIIAALVTAAGWALRKKQSALVRWGLVVALLVANGAVTFGADRGALLVYGYGMATGTLPPEAGGGHSHGEGEGHSHGDGDGDADGDKAGGHKDGDGHSHGGGDEHGEGGGHAH